MSAEQITDEQLCWEYIKYEIRKLSLRFSKEKAKKARAETVTSEIKLKELEQNLCCIFDRNYLDYKNKLEQIYEQKANGVKIRSKSEWYEFEEKSLKFFLNIEKQHALLNQVRSLLCSEKEVTDKHNGRTATTYFKLERGTRQGNPISAYLFILNLKIALLFIMQNENTNGLNIFENTFLYTVYADDTTFFLKD